MRVQAEPPTPSNQIAAIVVTYNPEATVLENVRRLTAQVPEVVVVDNGSTGSSSAIVTALEQMAGVTVIRHATNLGIAAAMNTGIRHALAGGYQWIATFDQDSTVPDGYFDGLLAALDVSPKPDSVGVVVPGCWQTIRKSNTSQSSTYGFVTAAPNSGSLIRGSIFSEIGFYDEPMFIDYVDMEFCLRAGRKGYRILSASRIELGHELGTKETRTVLGRQISFRAHTAWRYYYIMRNRVVVYRRYGRYFPRLLVRDACWILLELGRMACLEGGKARKLRCALQGLWDGLHGRLGRHPNFPA